MELSTIVDLETAKAARGVRMVVTGMVPSPWGEAAKAVFRIGGVPTLWVRSKRDDAALSAWTRAHNVPVVLHDDDPPRTGWAEIVTLAARLAKTPIVPSAAEQRARTFGLLHEIAGEDGLGWCGRLVMIDASLATDGARGFPLPLGKYLAPKYGHAKERVATARARMVEVLELFERELARSESEYLFGASPGALDAYLATFVTVMVGVPHEDCPSMRPELRAAFDTVRDEMAGAVPASLIAHRRRMYERHLPFPIPL